jgi:hypothetical protein
VFHKVPTYGFLYPHGAAISWRGPHNILFIEQADWLEKYPFRNTSRCFCIHLIHTLRVPKNKRIRLFDRLHILKRPQVYLLPNYELMDNNNATTDKYLKNCKTMTTTAHTCVRVHAYAPARTGAANPDHLKQEYAVDYSEQKICDSESMYV